LMHLYRFYSFSYVFNCQRTFATQLRITNCDLNWNRNP